MDLLAGKSFLMPQTRTQPCTVQIFWSNYFYLDPLLELNNRFRLHSFCLCPGTNPLRDQPPCVWYVWSWKHRKISWTLLHMCLYFMCSECAKVHQVQCTNQARGLKLSRVLQIISSFPNQKYVYAGRERKRLFSSYKLRRLLPRVSPISFFSCIQLKLLLVVRPT